MAWCIVTSLGKTGHKGAIFDFLAIKLKSLLQGIQVMLLVLLYKNNFCIHVTCTGDANLSLYMKTCSPGFSQNQSQLTMFKADNDSLVTIDLVFVTVTRGLGVKMKRKLML